MPVEDTNPGSSTLATLRHHARGFLAIVETDIHSGSWAVDGANDPESAVRRLGNALRLPIGRAIIANLAMDLIDCAVAAIAYGEWSADQEAIGALCDLNDAATMLTTSVADGELGAVAMAA